MSLERCVHQMRDAVLSTGWLACRQLGGGAATVVPPTREERKWAPPVCACDDDTAPADDFNSNCVVDHDNDAADNITRAGRF